MAIYAIGDSEPNVDSTAFVHPQATVIGNVTLAPHSSVWPQAVLRGDYGSIYIGTGSNVQDGAVIHATDDLPTIVGDLVVIGHLAHLEGCTVHDRALIGVGFRRSAPGSGRDWSDSRCRSRNHEWDAGACKIARGGGPGDHQGGSLRSRRDRIHGEGLHRQQRTVP